MDEKPIPNAYAPSCLEILKAVEKYRYLSISQIQVLFGMPKYQETKKIVLQLWKSYFLERLVLTRAGTRISICYVFALSLKGARQIAQATGKENIFYLRPRAQRSTLFLEHTIFLNNFHICLELLARKRKDLRLVFWKQDKEEVKVYLNE